MALEAVKLVGAGLATISIRGVSVVIVGSLALSLLMANAYD